MSWKTLGSVAPENLLDARLQLHHAAQIVASAGTTLLAPRPDDSHPNLGWVEPLGALVGHRLPGPGVQAGLRLADLSLIVVEASGRIAEELSLGGMTVEGGYAWLAKSLVAAGVELPDAGLTRPEYEIPDHAVAGGAPFAPSSGDAPAELARWYANGHEALTALAARTPGASDTRCWPHHFDLGWLAAVATGPDGNLEKSVGVGLSPGDESYSEPYWYVSPWPYPQRSALPALASGGHWHTEGYTAAILTASDLIAADAANQADRLREFLANSVAAAGCLLAA